MRLRRRPDASSLQFILNVAQLLGQSAHNAPLLLPLLPMILHGMARHLESDGVQVCRRDPELAKCMHTLLATRRALGFALRARITRTARALLYAQECGVGLFANLAVPRASRSSLVANGCLQHTFLSLRQYPDNAMLHRNAFRLLRNVFVAAGHADADADADADELLLFSVRYRMMDPSPDTSTRLLKYLSMSAFVAESPLLRPL